ncbi:Protein fam49a [Rhizophlyctis rosea]|uniref:Protein fam49a n=1 Tax=Rhizophlyctis rosea TaxID=64517 RepID=A0AAD5SKN6_9FUNG|nr:Protein fam49a [Rhizophlyctis rosea]
MGPLLSILRGGGQADEPPLDIPVDFDGAKPTPEEAEIYNYITRLLQPASIYLEDLRNYKGCGDAIRKAISSPSRESEEAAWAAVCPAVLKLKEYYEFGLRLQEEAFPRLLSFICQGDVVRNLETRQATARRLADVLHFVSLFDELKMGNPNVQNDFSYYRRTLSRMRMSNPNQQNVVVHDELANRMSLFYAHSTPMTKSLIDSALMLVNSVSFRLFLCPANRSIPAENVTDVFAVFCGICYNAVTKGRAQGAMVDYCLRVMVVCIILYDHVDPAGAFAKGSKLNIRASVRVIQTNGGSGSNSLLNTLRYSTVHLNDDATPKVIKQMLAT